MNGVVIAKLILTGLVIVSILGVLFGWFLGKIDKEAIQTIKEG